jgi:HK97 family phage prohead protease
MELDIKTAAFELKVAPDEDGTFEGYASVFDVVDLGLDSVAPGAFAKSLTERKPKMLWQHDMGEPIGVWDEVREDDKGLFVKGRLLKDVQRGREAIALLKAGAIDGMSIGYRTVEAMAEGGGRVRKLMEVELHEISIVTNPMLPIAKVTAVKSLATEREFEAFLRDAGYSRKEATAIALHGFKGLTGLRDAGSDDGDQGAKALLQSLEKLKGAFHV